MSARDGGDAFPSPGVVLGQARQEQQGAYAGMTLRDYFSAQALSGLLVAYRGRWQMPGASEQLAIAAFEIADAMLKARTQ